MIEVTLYKKNVPDAIYVQFNLNYPNFDYLNTLFICTLYTSIHALMHMLISELD